MASLNIWAKKRSKLNYNLEVKYPVHQYIKNAQPSKSKKIASLPIASVSLLAYKQHMKGNVKYSSENKSSSQVDVKYTYMSVYVGIKETEVHNGTYITRQSKAITKLH